MADLYLATNADLDERMFPGGDVKPCTFVPGFIEGHQVAFPPFKDIDETDAITSGAGVIWVHRVAYVPFKDTIDEAIEAAIKGLSQAHDVVRRDTTWVVRRVHLTFDDIGRLTHANALQRVPRGYRVLKTLTKEADKLSVRWPRWTVQKYLVNRGYKMCDKVNKACRYVCSEHPNLYLVHDDKYICETCLTYTFETEVELQAKADA
jgi:hypothetical protein